MDEGTGRSELPDVVSPETLVLPRPVPEDMLDEDFPLARIFIGIARVEVEVSRARSTKQSCRECFVCIVVNLK
jgi:hypothetical protein